MALLLTLGAAAPGTSRTALAVTLFQVKEVRQDRARCVWHSSRPFAMALVSFVRQVRLTEISSLCPCSYVARYWRIEILRSQYMHARTQKPAGVLPPSPPPIAGKAPPQHSTGEDAQKEVRTGKLKEGRDLKGTKENRREILDEKKNVHIRLHAHGAACGPGPEA